LLCSCYWPRLGALILYSCSYFGAAGSRLMLGMRLERRTLLKTSDLIAFGCAGCVMEPCGEWFRESSKFKFVSSCFDRLLDSGASWSLDSDVACRSCGAGPSIPWLCVGALESAGYSTGGRAMGRFSLVPVI
jgi:hypothetical protein